MLTEDYFMRMINQMLAVLTQILYHTEVGQHQEAQTLIDQSLEQLLGIRPNLLKQMDEKSILQLLTTQGELDPDRIVIVADLYKMEGDLFAKQTRKPEALQDYQRALKFYLEISLSSANQDHYNIEYKVNDLTTKLSGVELPVEVMFQLFDYYEMRGDYAKVDEQASCILKSQGLEQEMLPELIAFYEKMLGLDEIEIQKSGISKRVLEQRLFDLNERWLGID